MRSTYLNFALCCVCLFISNIERQGCILTGIRGKIKTGKQTKSLKFHDTQRIFDGLGICKRRKKIVLGKNTFPFFFRFFACPNI